ncbi:META domain-containing protein [Acetobacter senegalensis]|uniref:META domain-containing protein n=1 Tax=Acetobacter senegalensis TaxID=446692 RepID=UPI001EDBD0A4|nr:META domain-containing protein [Acetobacter senegalensis]
MSEINEQDEASKRCKAKESQSEDKHPAALRTFSLPRVTTGLHDYTSPLNALLQDICILRLAMTTFHEAKKRKIRLKLFLNSGRVLRHTCLMEQTRYGTEIMRIFRLSSGKQGVIRRGGGGTMERGVRSISAMGLAGAALCTSGFLAGCASQDAKPVASSHAASSVYQASGNEPSWHLTLAQNTLTLQQPGSPELVRAVTHAHTDSGERIYEAQDLKAVMTPAACTDSMSNQRFMEKVRVTVQGHTLQGCGGDAEGPATLNDTRWVVTALNGKPIAAGSHAPTEADRTTDQPGHENTPPVVAPTLDVNATGKVSGSDGCNRYVGGLTFGPKGTVQAAKAGGISTMMACFGSGGTISRSFNDLKGAVTHWHVDGNTLVLETSDNRTIHLRQVF